MNAPHKYVNESLKFILILIKIYRFYSIYRVRDLTGILPYLKQTL